MLWEKFEKRFGADSASGLKFDRVLQYVTFPQVEVHLTGRRADMERDAEFQSGIRSVGILGRRDMSYFFDWLYKKGVRHIIRVSVEDSKETGQKVHSDKAIQDSLARFTIEHLDWNKTDLDPETILHVGSKAEKDPLSDQEPLPGRELKYLTLRWSGSNAVLRAWGELEGLPLLPDLQKIYLYTPHPEKARKDPPYRQHRSNLLTKTRHTTAQTGSEARLMPSNKGSTRAVGKSGRPLPMTISEMSMSSPRTRPWKSSARSHRVGNHISQASLAPSKESTHISGWMPRRGSPAKWSHSGVPLSMTS